MTLPTIVSFWHGPMSWLEILCIRSFVRQGHAFAIYAYDPIENLPEGAEWRDAAAILPRDRMTFYKGRGTPAVFSDWFRLELLKRDLGIYSDLDVYCLAPLPMPQGPMMAWERPGSINNAVLYIPPDAPLLEELRNIFVAPSRALFVPYLPPLRRAEIAIRRLLGDPVPPENMQFGATGPMPLTYFVRKHGLLDRVLPSSSFYPLPYEAIPDLMQPGTDIDTLIKPDTLGIHLWRSQLTDRGRAGLPLPPPRSPLATLCERQSLDPSAL